MFLKRISLRIAAWSAFCFLVGALILFCLTSYLLHSSLQQKDQDLLEAKFFDYSRLLERDGLEALEDRVLSKESPDAEKFLVRFQSSKGDTALIYVPPTMELVGQVMSLSEFDHRLKTEISKGSWTVIHGQEFGDDVEVISRPVGGGYLQVGKDTEDREDFFKHFIRSFFLGLLPVILLATVLGAFLSGRILAPIRRLIETVKKIRSGNPSARVRLHETQDELHELGRLFNEMQDQNVRLIQGMKDTLDNVAHDLRTPMTRFRASAELALTAHSGEQETSSRLYQALEEAQESALTIQNLLNTLMDISEAEAGMMNLKSEPVPVLELFEKISDLYSVILEEKSIAIQVAVEPAHLTLFGDRIRLLQAIANLIDNAVKFSPEGSTVRLSASTRNARVCIEVVDQGLGIREDDIPKIWNRLFRADQSRSTRGLGLGLSLVAAIVRSHGGTIDVESTFGKGTTFRLMLPMATA